MVLSTSRRCSHLANGCQRSVRSPSLLSRFEAMLLLLMVLNVVSISSASGIGDGWTKETCITDLTDATRKHHGFHFDRQTGGYSIDVTINVNSAVRHGCGVKPSAGSSASFLRHLEEVFTKASQIMHVATRHHAHIGEVRFLLNDTWPRDNLPGGLQCLKGDENLKQSILISEGNSCIAKVSGNCECGKAALGPLEMTTGAFSRCDVNTCSDPAKTFVHEFAHLEWGLGDEYAKLDNGSKSPLCPKNASSSAVSLMARTDEADAHFCDSLGDSTVRHDPNAATKHNSMCNRMSAWEVLRRFQNFTAGSARKPNAELVPKFRYVTKCAGELTVFAVDLSAKSSRSFLRRAQQHMLTHINDRSSAYSSVALVTYGGSSVSAWAPAFLIADAKGKRELTNQILDLRCGHGRADVTSDATLSDALTRARDMVHGMLTTRRRPLPHETRRHQVIVISQEPAASTGASRPPLRNADKILDVLFLGAKKYQMSPRGLQWYDDITRLFWNPTKCAKLKYINDFFTKRTRTVFDGALQVKRSAQNPSSPLAGRINLMTLYSTDQPRDVCLTMNIIAPDSDFRNFTSTFHFTATNQTFRKVATAASSFQTYEVSSAIRHIYFKLFIVPGAPGHYRLFVNATPKKSGRKCGERLFNPSLAEQVRSAHATR